MTSFIIFGWLFCVSCLFVFASCLFVVSYCSDLVSQRDAEITRGTEESPATKQLRRALDLDPDDGYMLALLALKLAAHHKHEEAESLVDRALSVSPDSLQVTRYVGRYFRQQVSPKR